MDTSRTTVFSVGLIVIAVAVTIIHIVVFKRQGGVLVHDQNTTLAIWMRRRVSVKRGVAKPAI